MVNATQQKVLSRNRYRRPESLVQFICPQNLKLRPGFENESQPDQFKSIPHCLWWAVTTLTTVGYGDVYPITLGGRIFTFFVLMIGLGIVAVPAGLVASAFSKIREENEENAEAEAAEGSGGKNAQ